MLKLDLEHRLAIAAVCTIVQLLLIGFVLEWVFRVNRWYVVVVMMSIMTLVAGIAAIQRTTIRFPGVWARSIAATWISSWLVAVLALGVIVRVRPWYTPQYAIPLLGMILGNTLNGVSLGLDRLGSELTSKRDQVEALLTLGATPLGGCAAADSAGGQDWAHSDDQRDDGRWHREPSAAACIYMAVKAGNAIEAAIPIAIMAIFFGRKGLKRSGKSTLLENVIVQSIGQAAGVVAAGAAFIIPAFYINGLEVHWWQTFLASPSVVSWGPC